MSGDSAAPVSAARNTAAPGSATRWSLRDLMLVVLLGVVFGFLYWALVQGWIALSALAGPFGDLVQHVLLGGWLLVAPLAIAIVRRPFAGVVSEVIASVIEVVFLGSAVGPTLLIAAAIQGAGSELPFAAGRYRSYGWVRYMLSGALGAGAVFFYSAFRSGWYGTDLFWTRFVIQVLSGAIVGGLLAKVLVLAIARTGAVDNFAIGRDTAAAR